MIHDGASGKRRAPHWARFRAGLLWNAGLSSALAAGALLWMRALGTPITWQGRVAVGTGVFFTMMLTGALMGLLFASARGGHDSAAGAPGGEE